MVAPVHTPTQPLTPLKFFGFDNSAILNAHRRPCIEEVGALVAGQLMGALERLTANEQRLVRALTLERAHHKCVCVCVTVCACV